MPKKLMKCVLINKKVLIKIFIKMEQPSPIVRRKILSAGVSAVLNELGFESCEKIVLETLTEMLQCFIIECGQSARNYCELTGRTEPLIGDVVMAMMSMGVSLTNIEQYARRINRTILPTPQAWQPQKQLNMLQAGTKQPHPSHVPAHLPSFPHPHAYIRTPTHKQPVTEYEAIREKAATQKRDVERALTRFLAKTGPTHNLFQIDDSNIYPLIACKRLFPPYLSALLPQDQIFDPEDLEYDPTNPENNPDLTSNSLNRKRSKSETAQSETSNNEGQDENETENAENSGASPQKKTEEKEQVNPEIDNPYLRATKMPRKKLITKINVSNSTCSNVE